MFERLKPGRLLVELGVVVLGVGLALAADGWREDRELRARELSYLRAILTDMEEAREVVRVELDESSGYVDQVLEALRLLNTPDAVPKDESWRLLHLYVAQLSIPNGTLQALVNSGDLSLIVSEELRATLIRESAAVSTHQKWIEQAAAQALPNVREALYELEVFRIRAQSTGEAPSVDDFRKSPRITAAHQIHLNLLQNQRTSIRAVSRSVESIHAAVSEELQRRGD